MPNLTVPSGRRLTAFVSSAMQELHDERQAIKAALEELKVDAWVYEEDAGARDQNTRATYLQELEAADVYVGIFWKRYGAYTIEEYRQARAWQKPRLLFVKRAAEEEREEALRAFLNEVTAVGGDRAARWFIGPDDLCNFIKDDIARWQVQAVRRTMEGDPPPFQVEPLGDQYVERPAVMALAKASWLARDAEGLPLVTRAAFHGLGGSGKSVMARAFVHDDTVREAFPDGVLSATLGYDAPQSSDVIRSLSAWGRALHDGSMPAGGYPDPITGSGALRTLLQNRACLLLVDDVWKASDVRPFLVGGPRCLLLLTTRKLEVADAVGANSIELSQMTLDEGLALVERWSGPLSPDDRQIVVALGQDVEWLPLALELMAAQAKRYGWPAYRERWQEQKLTLLKRGRRGAGKEDNVADSLELSFQSLDEDRDAYLELTVFGANTPFPPSAAAALWQTPESDAEDLLSDCADQALLNRVGQKDRTRYALHSLLHDFISRQLGAGIAQAHSNLVDGYLRRSSDGWAGVPDDGYFGNRLAFHLVGAGRTGDLWGLLNRSWMEARFKRAMSHVSFLADVRAGLQAARRPPVNVAAFVRCSVIHMAVSDLAADDPTNVPPALAEFGQIDLALVRADGMPRVDYKVQAFIDIALELSKQNRRDEAVDAVERAVTAVEQDLQGFRAERKLASAACCLARLGRDSSAILLKARTLALDKVTDNPSECVPALARVAEGFHVLNRPEMVSELTGEMWRKLDSSNPQNSMWAFAEAAEALAAIGSTPLLFELRDRALALRRDGIGGYPLSSVAEALAECGELDAALTAARQLPEVYSQIDVFSKIAAHLAHVGRGADATALLHEAVERLEGEVQRDVSKWRYVEHLIAAAAAIGTMEPVERLLALDIPDAIWHARFLAAFAKAEHAIDLRSKRPSDLARRALALLRRAMAEEELRAEAVRSETARWLADAGAIDEALAVAADIGDARYQREALAATAVCLLRTGQRAQGTDVLMRALAAGSPDPNSRVRNRASAANALARLGDSARARAAITTCLSERDTLATGDDTKQLVSVLAADVFDRCGEPGRAKDEARSAFRVLFSPKGTYDLTTRGRIVRLAARAMTVDEFETTLASGGVNFRRTIAGAAVEGFQAIGEPDRARKFLETLESDQRYYPPWAEMPKVDALGRMFSLSDDSIRSWVLDAANDLKSPDARSLLLARCAGVLAAEGRPEAADLGRQAIASALSISDPSQRPLFALARIFAAGCQRDLLMGILDMLVEPLDRSAALGELAVAFAAKGLVDEARSTLETIEPASVRGFWVTSTADALFDAKAYDAGRALHDLLITWPAQLPNDYGDVQTALALARHGANDEAERAARSLLARMTESQSAKTGRALVLADLALCFGLLGLNEIARELTHRAEQREGQGWGSLVPAALAAARNLLGDDARAQSHAAETIRRLQTEDAENLGSRLEACARRWRIGRVGFFDTLLPVLDGLEDERVRADAVEMLTRGMADAASPSVLSSLIDRATAITDIWIRIRALGAVADAAAAARDRASLLRILRISPEFDNDWATGSLVVRLAAAAARLTDEDLLSTVLATTSSLRAKNWRSVEAFAAAASTVAATGDAVRAAALGRRALEIASKGVQADMYERATYDVEMIACRTLLGGDVEALALLRGVLGVVERTSSAYSRDSLLEALRRAVLSVSNGALLDQLAVPNYPGLAAVAAFQLAKVGQRDAATRLVDRLRDQVADASPNARVDVLMQCAQTLAVLGRSEEALTCLLDAVDAGRVLDASSHPVVIDQFAEVLGDLQHHEGVSSLADALDETGQWWSAARPVNSQD